LLCTRPTVVALRIAALWSVQVIGIPEAGRFCRTAVVALGIGPAGANDVAVECAVIVRATLSGDRTRLADIRATCCRVGESNRDVTNGNGGDRGKSQR
jgi:hypothetical protein